MEGNRFVVVNANDFSGVYSIHETIEDAELGVFDAKNDARTNAITFKAYAEKYGKSDPKTAEYWMVRAEKEKNALYQVMTYEEFFKRQREFFVDRPVTETSSEDYYAHLEMLPPMHWITINGVEMFCMSEFYASVYTNQYARVGDKYYTAFVDAFDRTTWIHNRLPQ